MPAFVIIEIDVKDPVGYAEYIKLTPPTLLIYEGKFVVRGGPVEVIEGNWKPGRLVILEFPSAEKAKQWWSSPEYAPAKALRQRTAYTDMILMEGFTGLKS